MQYHCEKTAFPRKIELDYQCLGYKSLFTLIVQHKYCTTLVFGTVQALVNCKCVHEKNSIAYLTSPIAEYINYTNTKKKEKDEYFDSLHSNLFSVCSCMF